jgi:dipeptidyl aminopeptidase/acylaminoacyl peptidase
MNADGSGVTRLTTNRGSDAIPTWSPDGTKIAFQSDRDGNFEIYVMNPDGTGVARLTNNAASDGGPEWSPDGSKIAFTSQRDGDAEVYVMNADGSGQTNVTDNPADDLLGAWSPDGTKIVFQSRRDDFNGDIFVMNADGSAQTNISNSTRAELQPDWQTVATTSTTVAVDIKPDGEPNSINLGNGGVVPVAILTTKNFDATTVDPSSVCFGDAEAPSERDCSEKHGTDHIEDVDGDGDLDLLLLYETAQTGIDSGDTRACLTGKTLAGTPIEGCDAVRIVPRS